MAHPGAGLHRAVLDYIEGWYNTRRLHSAHGHLSPAEYESAHHNAARPDERRCRLWLSVPGLPGREHEATAVAQHLVETGELLGASYPEQ
jgi:hypothetical protein